MAIALVHGALKNMTNLSGCLDQLITFVARISLGSLGGGGCPGFSTWIDMEEIATKSESHTIEEYSQNVLLVLIKSWWIFCSHTIFGW